MGRRWQLDPILFGPEPAARARSLIERKRWVDAGKAFDEAVRAGHTTLPSGSSVAASLLTGE